MTRKMNGVQWTHEEYKALLYRYYETISEVRKAINDYDIKEARKILRYECARVNNELVAENVCPKCGDDLQEFTHKIKEEHQGMTYTATVLDYKKCVNP